MNIKEDVNKVLMEQNIHLDNGVYTFLFNDAKIVVDISMSLIKKIEVEPI